MPLFGRQRGRARPLVATCVFVSLLWLSPAAQDPAGVGAPAILGVPTALPQDGLPDILIGPVRGGGGIVRLVSGAPGHALLASGAPFGAFAGGVRVATGDVDGDGIADFITAQGPGGSLVRVFSGADVHEIAQGYPFGPGFFGGVNVAAGDVTGDGHDDVVVATAVGGWVKVYSLAGGVAQVAAGFPYGPLFTRGVRVATGDLNGDGRSDVITAPETGGGLVQIFNAAGPALIASVPFAQSVYIATGDLDGDRRADVIASPAAGLGPIVAYSGATYTPLVSIGPGVPGGISVAAADVTGDGRAEIVGGLGPGSAPIVGLVDGLTAAILASFTVATDPPLPDGVYVATTTTSRIRFTSAATTTFTTGTSDTFTVTTSAIPSVATIASSGALPGGVTFTDNHDGTATLSGTPAAAAGGDYTLTFTASNGAASEIQTFTLRVEGAPQITSGDTTTFNVGVPGAFTITTSGFPSPSLTHSGTLPAGVTFTDHGDGSATLAGTPGSGSGGTYALSLTASNGVGVNATQVFTLFVDASPAFTSAATTTFTLGSPGSFAISATAEPAIVTITQAGGLPAGVSFTDNGGGSATLSGTPTVSGEFTFTLTASNGGVGSNAVQAFTLTVQRAPAITSASAVTFRVGTASSFDVTATGFPTPVLAVTGTVPAGLALTDNGDGSVTLAGTPASGSGGTYTLGVAASNGVGGTASASLTITVEDGAAITSAAAVTFEVGELGAFLVTTTGLPLPSLSAAGALPAGVTFVDLGNGTASLGGTPASGEGGAYPLTITATNPISGPAVQSFVLTVNQPPTFSSVSSTTFTVNVAGTFTVATAAFPVATIGSSDALPSGVTLTDNGDGTATLAGTPAAGSTGGHTVTLSASNGIGAAVTQSFTLTIDEGPAIISASAATFAVGATAAFTVQTSGVPAPSIARGGVPVLPGGVTWQDNNDGTGTLGGLSADGTGGVYALTFQATNSAGTSPLQTFTLTINEAPAFTSANATTFTVGTAGSFSIATDGFPAAVLTSSALPNGVTLTDHGNGSATLSGTPIAGTGGTHTITLQASNVAGAAPPQSFTLTIREAPTMTSAAAATFTVGASGNFSVQTTGTPAPSIARGGVPTLPSGLSWLDNGNGSGTLSGTPADGTGGTYALTFQATNSVGVSPLQTFTLTINEAPEFTSAASASFVAGSAVNFGVTASGTPAPDITHSGGALPAGLIYNDATNSIQGTPTAVGTFAPQFTATNGIGPNVVQSFALEITCAPITVSSLPSTVPNATFNVVYAGATFSQTGGGAGSWSASGLPPGLSIDSSTGALGGTPSNTGVFAGTVTYTVPGPCTGSKNISIAVAPNAQNDSYAAGYGNTQIVAANHSTPSTPFFAFSSGVMSNDAGPAGTAVVPAAAATTALGGTITIAATGAFVYTPQAGDSGNDSYTYTLTSNGVTASATITLALGTQRIWYIDDVGSNGSGTSSSPFNTLTSVNGASDADAPGDVIYIHSGTFSGGLTTEASQTVWGAGAAFSPNANLTIAAGAKPTVQGTVTIAGNNVTISSFALSTGAATGMTNSGTVTGLTVKNGVTVATTTGTAVSFSNVDSTSGGAPAFGINFLSVGASNPSTSGIVLNGVNQTTGTFVVTGTGTTDGSGGTIDSASGPGIALTNTRNVSLSNINVTNGDDDGIQGSNVTTLAVHNANITNNGTPTSPGGLNESGIDIAGLFGTAVVEDSTITNSADSNIMVKNSAGPALNMTVQRNVIQLNKSLGSGDGILAESGGTANMSLLIDDNDFAEHWGDHIQATALNSGVMHVAVTNNTMLGDTPAGTLPQPSLSNAVVVNAATGVPGYNGTVTYDISNNNITGAVLSGVTVNLGTSSVAATFSGKIVGNTFGSAAPLSCSTQANAIFVDAHGNGSHSVGIRNNIIQNCQDRGIGVLANDGNGVLNINITGNSITNLGTAGREAISVVAGSVDPNIFGVPDGHQVCIGLGGAGALRNTLTNGGDAGVDDFLIRQRFNTTVRVPGYTGGAQDTAAVKAFIIGNNNTTQGQITAAGTGGGYLNTAGGAACVTP